MALSRSSMAGMLLLPIVFGLCPKAPAKSSAFVELRFDKLKKKSSSIYHFSCRITVRQQRRLWVRQPGRRVLRRLGIRVVWRARRVRPGHVWVQRPAVLGGGAGGRDRERRGGQPGGAPRRGLRLCSHARLACIIYFMIQ